MKNRIIFLIIMLIPLIFSSCSYGETELKNRLIIEGIGVDYDNEKNEYIVTAQTLNTSQSGGEESTPEKPFINYSANGKTIAEALNMLSDATGKNPLFSQNRVIIFGKSLSGSEKVKSLDFFAREYTARADVLVASSKGDAADIFAVESGEGEITAKVIEEAIIECGKNSVSVNTELFNAVNLSLEENTSFTMPLIEISKERNGEKAAVRVSGTYVYTDGEEMNTLDSEETMFFLLLTGKAENGTFSVSANDSEAALDLIKCKTKIDVSSNKGAPKFDITVKCDADMIEYDTEKIGFVSADDAEKVKEAAEEYLKKGMYELLEKQLGEEKCDIFRFGRRFMKKYPDEYENIKNDWESILSEIQYTVNTNVNIRRIGQESIQM